MLLALSFRRSDPYALLRSGSLVRLELRGQTSLALKAKGGRLGPSLSSQW